MSATVELGNVLKALMEGQEKRHREQMEAQERRMTELIDKLAGMSGLGSTGTPASVPPQGVPGFVPFDPTEELWNDYWSRFQMFAGANSIPGEKVAQVFLTNQTATVYKLLSTLAGQQTPPKEINSLSVQEICGFMEGQFDPKQFVVRERFRFWSDMERKPGESVQELAARIRHDAAKCDFPSIKDPQDEAMRTRFICSVGSEATVKAMFKVPDDELTFGRAVQVAQETEDAAKVARETAGGGQWEPKEVYKVVAGEQHRKSKATPRKQVSNRDSSQPGGCCRCCSQSHGSNECPYGSATCYGCGETGHIRRACPRKKAAGSPETVRVSVIREPMFDRVKEEPLKQQVKLNGRLIHMEVETGSEEQFMDETTWKAVGKPKLAKANLEYVHSHEGSFKVIGKCVVKATTDSGEPTVDMTVNVSKWHGFNVLGRNGIKLLSVSVDELLYHSIDWGSATETKSATDSPVTDDRVSESGSWITTSSGASSAGYTPTGKVPKRARSGKGCRGKKKRCFASGGPKAGGEVLCSGTTY